jgi:ubiquinone/menaquinone biosynthesis C-methylase UbiE
MKGQEGKNSAAKTSWENVSQWYDTMLQSGDTYQSKVILPNILRILDPKPGKHIVELGCGQGYFSEIFAKMGASVIGLDASKTLIEIAEKRVEKEAYRSKVLFITGDASNAQAIVSKTADVVVVILALQNMKDLSKVAGEMQRILKQDGRALIVLNHPVFRIPKHSDWGFDEVTKTQYRKVSKYLSELTLDIDMEPGRTAIGMKGAVTKSFHRSLQTYTKSFANAGLAITRIEEWISHKQSQKGPRQVAEDTARKEIPLFMCLELKKLS